MVFFLGPNLSRRNYYVTFNEYLRSKYFIFVCQISKYIVPLWRFVELVLTAL